MASGVKRSAGLMLGLILGLGFGLLIGWIFWPVEWTDAQPSDLGPEAKAALVFAVAQDHAASGVREVSQAKVDLLSQFGDPVQLVADALALSEAQTEQQVGVQSRNEFNIRQSNLRILQQDLGNLQGFRSPDEIRQAQTEAALLGQESASAPQSGDLTEPADDPVVALLLRMVIWLVVLGMILGVAWVIMQFWFSFKRNNPPATVDPLPTRITPTIDQEPIMDIPWSGDLVPRPEIPRSSIEMEPFNRPPDLPFPKDTELDQIEEGFDEYDDPDLDDEEFGESDLDDPEEDTDDGAEDAKWEDVDLIKPDLPGQSAHRLDPASPARPPLSVPATPERESPKRPRLPSWTGSNLDLRTLTGGRRQPEVVSPAQGQEGQTTQQFKATFHMSDNDYEEVFHISHPTTGDYVGECGMAISDAATLTGSPDRVAVLEVWLFDKGQIRTQTQKLVSEHYFDQFMKENAKPSGDNPPPMVAREEGRFTLTGKGMRLECQIVDLAYQDGNPPASAFYSVIVEMQVMA